MTCEDGVVPVGLDASVANEAFHASACLACIIECNRGLCDDLRSDDEQMTTGFFCTEHFALQPRRRQVRRDTFFVCRVGR